MIEGVWLRGMVTVIVDRLVVVVVVKVWQGKVESVNGGH